VWVCRCVNDRVANCGDLPSVVHRWVLHTLWTSYSGVISDDSAVGCLAQRSAAGAGTALRSGRRPAATGRLQVGAGPSGRGVGPRREGLLAHLVQLGPGGHLLGHQGRLDAVEEPLEPPDQLGLGDPELGF
jgi:hypothetical protein